MFQHEWEGADLWKQAENGWGLATREAEQREVVVVDGRGLQAG